MEKIIAIRTISEGNQFLGLPKPKHPLINLIHHQDMVGQMPPADLRFRIDLYQVSFKDGMSGSLGYGRNTYDFQEGTLVFMEPGQIMTTGDQEGLDPGSGWVLFFHPDLIRRSPLGKTIEDYSFFSYEANEALHISDDERTMIIDLVQKIEKEYSQNIDKHSQKLIISTLELLLDYCQRFYDRQFYTRTNLNKDHLEKFRNILKTYYGSERPLHEGIPSVAYFGGEMHMSPKYLSDLLKKETGKSALDHIHDFIVDRAKTELLGSTTSISGIAYDLGFTYPQHFSKLFKRMTGMSPGEYRKAS